MYLSLFSNRNRALQELIDRNLDFMNFYDSRIDSGQYEIKSTESEHIIRVSLPGHNRDSVQVSVEEGRLVISASHPNAKESSIIKDETFKFALPKGCDAEKVDAQMSNGILTVAVSKQIEKPKAKRIETAVD